MKVRVGTSGFAYKQWKGSFYPEKLKDPQMLAFYAGRFSTVEINNTFYRMPARPALAKWAEDTPQGFSFVLKAPKRITHEKRLGDVADSVAYLVETASVMGPKLGPLLFQLPPFLKKDLSRLQAFLALLPAGQRAALEFRHQSWFSDDVYEALRAAGAALCFADTDEGRTPSEVTADWGYLRLRRTEYADAALAEWAEEVLSQPWREAYVFFKHEDEGKGPALAERLLDRLPPS
ncbi:MAG TPA: DUF72 domain-containing protein [Vicinamibacteria bacterium]|nr:DUF72 domain-containing protein [Vicinamibacteria bacterium]